MTDNAIEPGQKLTKALMDPESGRVLLRAGTVLTTAHIRQFGERGLLSELAKCVPPRYRFMDLDGFEIEIPELPDLIKMFNLQVPGGGLGRTFKALLVDDAAFMRNLLTKLLEPAGYECIEAASAREAVGKYAQFKPDVVTLDVYMPEIDGFAALQALRKLDPKAKVMMCTSSGHIDAVQRAIAAGASGYLKKPITAENLKAQLAKLGFPYRVAPSQEAKQGS